MKTLDLITGKVEEYTGTPEDVTAIMNKLLKENADQANVLKELKYELDEMTIDRDIWKDTDVVSQFAIKEHLATIKRMNEINKTLGMKTREAEKRNEELYRLYQAASH